MSKSSDITEYHSSEGLYEATKSRLRLLIAKTTQERLRRVVRLITGQKVNIKAKPTAQRLNRSNHEPDKVALVAQDCNFGCPHRSPLRTFPEKGTPTTTAVHPRSKAAIDIFSVGTRA